jgi:hypothetical protein
MYRRIASCTPLLAATAYAVFPSPSRTVGSAPECSNCFTRAAFPEDAALCRGKATAEPPLLAAFPWLCLGAFDSFACAQKNRVALLLPFMHCHHCHAGYCTASSNRWTCNVPNTQKTPCLLWGALKVVLNADNNRTKKKNEKDSNSE